MNWIKILKRLIDFSSIVAVLLMIFLPSSKPFLWDLALYAVFVLMCIRPLNDLFPKLGLIKLMPLRKNLGIFSSLIVVSLGVIHYISLGSQFLPTYFSIASWSGNLFWAHLGELTGFILLITSNKFSMRLLKRNWKRVQRLSYVYFFSGALYVFLAFNKVFALVALLVVFEATLFAYLKKKFISWGIFSEQASV